jgi:MSHA pilin protein MshA
MKKLTNNSFSKQKGFTLIELVVVIVILGILAATAVPKFIDLTSDARKSVMKGVQGSINSAVNLAHAKALVAGKTSDNDAIQIGDLFYALEHGYPVAQALGDGSTDLLGLGIKDLIELEEGTAISFTAASPTIITYTGVTDDSTCQLTYTNAEDPETPPALAAALTEC